MSASHPPRSLLDRLVLVRFARINHPWNPRQWKTEEQKNNKENQSILIESQEHFFSFSHRKFLLFLFLLTTV
jgi:hypothetical protein